MVRRESGQVVLPSHPQCTSEPAEGTRREDREIPGRVQPGRQELRLRRQLQAGRTTAQKKAAGHKGGKAAARRC